MKALTTFLRDLTGMAGIAAITYGSYLWSLQAALIVGGSLLLAISVLTAMGKPE